MYPLQDESARHSLLSQMFNDQGALLVEVGYYQQAIDVLVKALKLYEGVANVHEACTCNHCRLETCIARSKRATKPSAHSSMVKGNGGTGGGRFCHKLSPVSAFKGDDDLDVDMDEDGTACFLDRRGKGGNSGGYIYRYPIYCAPTFSHQDHHPGITLLVMILFNLALAYHLVSIVPFSSSPCSSSEVCHRRLTKALQLYEFFYELQMERNIFSTQAMLAVANNVGEIHRLVGNHNKHRTCLQHLTSCLMLVAEDVTSQNDSSMEQRQQQQQPNSRWNSATTRMQPNSEEMRGFWKNASQLVLQNNCACAA